MLTLSLQRIWRKVVQGQAITEPVLGGAPTLDGVTDEGTGLPAGIQNVPTLQLADRTEFLKWRHAASNPNRRNTMVACKLDTDGIPAFAAITASPLSANIVANNSTPLILSFAGGYDEHGPVDYYARVNANTAITPELGSGPERLYAVYDPITNTVDFQSFQSGSNGDYFHGIETPSPGSYKYWFDPNAAVMYKSTGSAWVQDWAVYLGTIDFAFLTVILEDPGKDATGGMVPTGSVVAFAGDSANVPYGWLLCQGQAVSRSVYRKLFIMFGTAYGPGDGSTTFNLPNLSGYFIRGYNDGGSGPDVMRIFGSTQTDSVGPHDHNAESPLDFVTFDPVAGTSWQLSSGGSNNAKPSTNTAQTGSDIGTETRPANVAMYYIIKY